jgi:hypothetical protein
MQKLVNVIALLSGLVSLGVLGGSFYLYKNADTLIEDARGKVIEEVKETIPKIVEGLMPDVPELPKTTGPAIPF